MENDKAMYTKLLTPPILYFPHGELASSPGNPVLDLTGGKFGPFAGQIIVGDQTRSNIMHANIEEVDGQYQGAVFNMIDALQSGAIRIHFAPDGALWIGQVGRGWRAVGGKEYGLEVIRWDGKTTPFELYSMNITKTGFKVTFTSPATLESLKANGAFSSKS